MDIPQVLEVLRPSEDWGPMAQTGVSYADFAPHWRGTSAVPTEAEMLAEWDALVATAADRLHARLRAEAKALIDATEDRVADLLRAIVLLTVAELNVLRQRDRDRSADVAAATSLDNLKTRWAARTALADRTAAQARQAIKNFLDAGDADA